MYVFALSSEPFGGRSARCHPRRCHAVLLDPDHLLRLPVGHAQLDEGGLLARRGDGGAARSLLGRRQHEQVANDDAADDCGFR
jgi:hypothetical protein